MIKKISISLFFLILFLLNFKKVIAVVEPSAVSNNKFGIHVFSEKDLDNAAALVNSNGGDWGYVTIVITEAERDHDRWQKVFDQMRRLHLIPIVRLATKATGGSWDAPQSAEINNWVAFLNSLNWVTENRYVIINNEPNHAAEWGNRIDPVGYAVYLKEISKKLKEASSDFFVLPAGLDPSSLNTSTSMTENRYLTQMINAEPDIFDSVDGWTSHAYSHTSTSVYNHELSYINKNLPVFVTETGWQNTKYSEDEIAQYIKNTFINIWNDPKVIAVTPFILDYTSPPFDDYSWKKKDGTFYKYYSEIQKMPKVAGQPKQTESGQMFAAFAQPIIFTGTDFVGIILAKNTGQTIWTSSNIKIGNETKDFTLKTISLHDIEPTRLGLIFFRAAETQNQGIYTNTLFLEGKDGKKITNGFSIEAWLTTIDKEKVSNFVNDTLKKVIKLQ